MSNTGSATYGNITVSWTASTSSTSLSVKITDGGSNLIGSMNFTPNTLNQTLAYENKPQSASGTFTAEFNAGGQSGTLTCSDFKWSLPSGSGGPVSAIVGIWGGV